MNRWVRLVVIFSITFVVYLGVFLSPYHLAFVSTQSVPFHFAVYSENVEKVENGDYVIFNWTKDDPNKKIKKGQKLTKKIFCSEGDFLVSNATRLTCNNMPSPIAQSHDSQGNKVDAWEYEGEIPAKHLFVKGNARNSYDSRYYGFIYKKDVIGKVVFTFL